MERFTILGFREEQINLGEHQRFSPGVIFRVSIIRPFHSQLFLSGLEFL